MTTSEYVVELYKNGEMVQRIAEEKQSTSLVEITKYLIYSHDLLDQVDLPYVPGRRKKPFIGLQSDVELSQENQQYHNVTDGIFIDTLSNKETKVRNIRRLCDVCDLEVKFREDW